MSNFVDYVKIHCKSGHGGAGSAHLRREKYIPKGGPDGGDGGRGGHIIMKGNAHEWTLLPLRYTRHIKAENGQPGGKNQLTGRFGEDVYIEVPVGTIAKNEDGDVIGEILEDGQEVILMHGGKGGLGNEHFKSATNQTPRYAQPGLPGEEGYIVFELKILADVGLVGFPNAGKSTLLSAVSAAKPKIADYAFTTLTPNLGIVDYRNYKSFVMADIPGIIEGAAEGKGLGHRFLRHIERNSILLFLIPADSEDHFQEFKILENELKEYNPELLNKQFIVSISKSDLLDAKLEEEIAAEFPEHMQPLFFSAVTGQGLQELKDKIWKILHDCSQKIIPLK
ncbi:GTPase ObgE [Riemerella columbipharyngis]|uniref:GTPase Obg n=1 Tax=Riemerella columbipharyngis TaxID=1071918 RepID=A0A1G7AP24_9FLAO|nr:GTPase ObgE [Riemerella columbipharyngis]SDE16619.1 GTP-binding protein [Riemerella columbipharyngis]